MPGRPGDSAGAIGHRGRSWARLARPALLLAAALALAAAFGLPSGRPGPAAAQVPPGGFAYRLQTTWSDAEWWLEAGRFAVVADAASTAQGVTFVLDSAHRAVHVVGPDGLARRVIRLPSPFDRAGGCRPRRLDLDARGRMVVLGTCDIGQEVPLGEDTTRSHLLVLTPEGLMERSIALALTYSDVAVDPQGRALLARLRPTILPARHAGDDPPPLPGGIDRIDEGGQVDWRIEHPSLFYPVGLDVSADGTIFVANRVPSPWIDPGTLPGPTQPPAAQGRAEDDVAVEGVVVFSERYAWLRTHPFTTPEDVAVARSGAYVSRNVELFRVGSTEPLWSGPTGQVVVGATDGVILHPAPHDGGLRAGIRHCYFQGLLDFGASGPQPRLIGSLDRPNLAGPTNPIRLDAGDRVALLQEPFQIVGEGASSMVIAGLQASEPQTVQQWSGRGLLERQLGLCAGGGSAWVTERGGARWAKDVAADGALVYTIDSNLLTARSAPGFPDWTFWPGSLVGPDAEPRLVAVSAHGGAVAVLDIGTGAVIVLGSDGLVRGRFELDRGAAAAVPTDIAMGDGVVWLAFGAQRRLWLLSLEGALLGAIDTHADCWRADAVSDGGVVTLDRAGWLYRYSVDGRLLASWAVPDAAADALDVTVDGADRVLVAWSVREARPGEPAEGPTLALPSAGVWVFAPGGAVEVPQFGLDACVVTADKFAAPAAVRRGGQVTVTLTMDGRCPARALRSDVAIVMDTSRSMNWHGALDRARDLAVILLDGLDPGAARAALVTFDSEARLEVPLTHDVSRVARRIGALDGWGDSRLGEGLRVAEAELNGDRFDALAHRIMVVVTDGEFTDVVRDVAEAARSSGIEIHAIVLPHGGVSGYVYALETVTGNRDRVLVDPDPRVLEARGRTWAGRIDEPMLLTTLTVVDVVPANMRLVEGHVLPEASVGAGRLQWDLRDVSARPVTMSYRLEPLETGVWPTNYSARAAYTDARGVEGDLLFPVPRVLVWDLATLTSRAYLPLALRHGCPVRAWPIDVVLALDASESMAAPDTTGDRTKLEAAREAAGVFLGLLDMPGDRAALVGFDEQAAVLSGLTGERATLLQVLGRLRSGTGTRIDRALDVSRGVLRHSPRVGAWQVIILLSDGLHGGDSGEVVALAERLRNEDVVVVTIGLGDDADDALLRAVATTPAAYHRAADTDALADVLADVLRSLPCHRRIR